ncbi:Dynein heavy chain 1, axonemal [Symbiodinium microadriaticum]|uniref:Dynein heavy chain 1, axonemal n=1 Tax=Symbiodinium microadriaticum TaxID=2951 RepID=A0A1Q9DRA3_SYMMI|nr:Dynein heavy chain 1, axonemal [Symbiodinium microadriaticum]
MPTGFSAAISACGVCSEWPWGLELLRNMGARAIPPDRIAFDAAISACALGIQWESGLALLASMGSREICPDEVSFNAAMSCCERSGRWMEALSLFALITELQPRPDAVSVGLACSAVAAAPWPLASALLGDEADDDRIGADGDDKIEEEGETKYMTPTSYLELIKLFTDLLGMKKGELDTKLNRYRVGAQRLKETETVVDKLKAARQLCVDLTKMQPVIEQGKKDLSRLFWLMLDAFDEI